MKLDTAHKGLTAIFRKYQEAILDNVWARGDEGTTSGQAFRHIQDDPDPEVHRSRASVIFFLNDMVEEGVLGFRDATGKGGHHRVYIPKLDLMGLGTKFIGEVMATLESAFPGHPKLKNCGEG